MCKENKDSIVKQIVTTLNKQNFFLCPGWDNENLCADPIARERSCLLCSARIDAENKLGLRPTSLSSTKGHIQKKYH